MQSPINLKKHLRTANEMLVRITEDKDCIPKNLSPSIRNYLQIFQNITSSNQQELIKVLLECYQTVIAMQQQFIKRYICKQDEQQEQESQFQRGLEHTKTIDKDSKRQRSTDFQSEIVESINDKVSVSASSSSVLMSQNIRNPKPSLNFKQHQKSSSSQSSLFSNLDHESEDSCKIKGIFKTSPVTSKRQIYQSKCPEIEESKAKILNGLKNIQEAEFEDHFLAVGPKKYIPNHRLHKQESIESQNAFPKLNVGQFERVHQWEIQKIVDYNSQIERLINSLRRQIQQLKNQVGELRQQNNNLAQLKEYWALKYSKTSLQLKQIKEKMIAENQPFILKQVAIEDSMYSKDESNQGEEGLGDMKNKIHKDLQSFVEAASRDQRNRGVILEGDESIIGSDIASEMDQGI